MKVILILLITIIGHCIYNTNAIPYYAIFGIFGAMMWSFAALLGLSASSTYEVYRR
jgi:hypothetical protein